MLSPTTRHCSIESGSTNSSSISKYIFIYPRKIPHRSARCESRMRNQDEPFFASSFQVTFLALPKTGAKTPWPCAVRLWQLPLGAQRRRFWHCIPQHGKHLQLGVEFSNIVSSTRMRIYQLIAGKFRGNFQSFRFSLTFLKPIDSCSWNILKPFNMVFNYHLMG